MQEHLNLTVLSANKFSFFTEHLPVPAFAVCQIHKTLSYNHSRKAPVKAPQILPQRLPQSSGEKN